MYHRGTEAQELNETRRKVAKALDHWADQLQEFMPVDALVESPRSDDTPENETLRLPSDFSPEVRHRLGLSSLAKIEFALRIRQLHDALEKLRSNLGLKSFLVRQKVRLSSGQGPLLRSESEINRAGRQVQKWKEVYQRAWKALNRLRDNGPMYEMEEELRVLRELKEEDCIMLCEWVEEQRTWQKLGQRAEVAARENVGGRRDLPWFWKIQFDISGDDLGSVDGAVKNWTSDSKNCSLFT